MQACAAEQASCGQQIHMPARQEYERGWPSSSSREAF